jgi:heme/copper-type cytochrome/quinol oxidase subunit 4
MASNSSIQSTFTKVATLLVATIYLLVPVYLFWHMGHMTDHHMVADQDCPYITGYSSVCPMDLSEHLSTWQHTPVVLPILKSITPYFNLLLISFLCLSLLLTQLICYLQRQRYRSIPMLFTSLFSQGILNGKAY